MSTNYHGKRVPTREDLQEIAGEALKGDLSTVKLMCDRFEQYHIGKQSMGQKFCFDHMGKKWNSFEEFKTFVNSLHIEDEYGRKITNEEFWKNVESTQHFKETGDYKLEGYCFSNVSDFC